MEISHVSTDSIFTALLLAIMVPMRLKGVSLVIALAIVLTALALSSHPNTSIAATGPTDIGTSGSGSGSGSTSNLVPVTCSVSKSSQLNTANDQCPAASPKYDYSCDYPTVKIVNGTEVQCEKGRQCSEPGGTSGVIIHGTCQCPSVCEATGQTQVAAGNGAPAGTGSQPQPPAVSPDKPPVSTQPPVSTGPASGTQVPPTSSPGSNPSGAGTSGSVNGSGATPVTPSPVSSGPVTPGAGSGSTGSQIPSVPVSTTPTPAPQPTPAFNGTPGLGNTATTPSAPANPFTPTQASPSGYTGTGVYTPTKPTFGGGGQNYSASGNGGVNVSASSPLTNAISSIGNSGINAFFSFVSGLLSGASSGGSSDSSGSSQTNVVENTRIVVQPNPVLTTLARVSQPTNTSNVTISQTTHSTQTYQPQSTDYQSYLDLFTGGAKITSPSDIASLVENMGNISGAATLAPSSILSLVQIGQNATDQQGISPTTLTIAMNAQIPSSTQLALNAINGLENYQNVSEQYYVAEANLAQAQNNYQWLEAQIVAWERAKQAGVCDSVCDNALGLLENAAPAQFQQVRQLQSIVDQGPFATTTATSASTTSIGMVSGQQISPVSVQIPGAQGVSVVASNSSVLQTPVPAAGAPFYVKQNNQWCDQYGQCIPESSFESSPTSSKPVVDINPPATSTIQVQATAAEDPVVSIVHVVQGWINSVLSLFTPSSSNANQPQQQCSLFKSLFGGCGKW
ncbi:MAG: hypothetical protein P4L81_00615 [Candidatus Pacebacteria bacterium]|nr:hypothetical protein [Candidatus Paceibacterota bacterium]